MGMVTDPVEIDPSNPDAVSGAWFYIILGIVGILCLAETGKGRPGGPCQRGDTINRCRP